MDQVRFLESHARVVLASESRPRAAVLSQLGIPFETMSSRFAEDIPTTGYTAEEYSLMNAKIKAETVRSKLMSQEENLLIVIGCDTVIENGYRNIIEKPADAAHATKILTCLSGKAHRVVTGVFIAMASKNGLNRWERSFTEVTEVRFAHLTQAAIYAYVASGEPMNKAGAYGIQGLGALFIESISGDYNNVVGIPLFRTLECISKFLDEILACRYCAFHRDFQLNVCTLYSL